jgi:hypothetical protein
MIAEACVPPEVFSATDCLKTQALKISRWNLHLTGDSFFSDLSSKVSNSHMLEWLSSSVKTDLYEYTLIFYKNFINF